MATKEISVAIKAEDYISEAVAKIQQNVAKLKDTEVTISIADNVKEQLAEVKAQLQTIRAVTAEKITAEREVMAQARATAAARKAAILEQGALSKKEANERITAINNELRASIAASQSRIALTKAESAEAIRASSEKMAKLTAEKAAKIRIDADTKAAEAEITRLKARAEKPVAVKVETSKTQGILDSIKSGNIGTVINEVGNLAPVLSTATGGAMRLAGSLGAIGATVGPIGLVAGGVLAIGAAVGSTMSTSIQYNAVLEQSKIAFDSMLGSAEESARIMEKLKKFAAETPFEFSEIAPAAQKLKAFGFEAKELIPVLTAAGNAAAGLGRGNEGLQHMAFVLGQIKATGKLMGQDVMQLSQLGVPVKDILAKNLGLAADEMDRIGDLGIDADTAIKALTDGMNERFPDMMRKLSNTWDGMWSTIRDNSMQLLGKIGEPIFEVAENIVNHVRDMFDSMLSGVNKGGLANIFTELLPPGIAENVAHLFTSIGQAFDGLKLALSTGGDIFANVKDSLLNLWEALPNDENISLLLTISDTIASAIVNTVRIVMAAVGDITDGIKEVTEWVKSIGDDIEEGLDNAQTAFNDWTDEVWNSVEETFNGIIDTVVGWVDDFCTWIEEGLSAACDIVANVGQSIYDTIAEVFDAVRAKVSAAIGLVVAVLNRFYSGAGTALVTFANKYIGIVGNWLKSVYDGIVNFVNRALDALGAVGDGIRAIGSAIGKAVGFAFNSASNFLGKTRVAQTLASLTTISGDTSADSGSSDSETSDGIREGKGFRRAGNTAKGGGGRGGGSRGGSGADKAVKEAERMAEKMKKLSEKIETGILAISDKIAEETGTVYEKGVLKLKQSLKGYEKTIKEASEMGIDTSKLKAKMAEYESVVKEKLVKAWKEANTDIVNESKLAWAKVRNDLREQAEIEYTIGVEKLNRQREQKLKEIALTKDSAEAKLTVEAWYNSQLAVLEKERGDTLRKSPATMAEAWRATLEEQYNRLKDQGQQMKALSDGMFNSMSEAFSNGFVDALTDGFDSIGKAFSNLLSDMVKQIARFLINQMVTKWIGGFLGGAPVAPAVPAVAGARATGGPVAYGKSYIVGERGPEIFTPYQSGRISNQMPMAAAPVAPKVNLVVNNNSGTEMSAKSNTRFDGKEYIVSVFLDAYNTNSGGLRDALAVR